MNDKIYIIPCNGLDRSVGVITRFVALGVIKKNPRFKLICPVCFNRKNEDNEMHLKETKIFVVDGCAMRCATDLIKQRGFQIEKKIFIPEMIKKFQITPEDNIILDENALKLADLIISEILSFTKLQNRETTINKENGEIEYFKIVRDKCSYEIPKSNYYFNENDAWIRPQGNYALIGISGFLQCRVGDVLFVELPKVGTLVEQFDEVCVFETSKTALQLISPGSGKISAANEKLEDNPELINQDPYEKGWFVEIELSKFEEDRELLMDGTTYFEHLKAMLGEDENGI
ncbi:MAG: putative zinc-binding protein [Candidatus Helarchaeota archaeon]